jgi:hypothetical protein
MAQLLVTHPVFFTAKEQVSTFSDLIYARRLAVRSDSISTVPRTPVA